MSDETVDGMPRELVLEFVLDAPVEKVWRAIDRPDLRAMWLPGCVPAEAAAPLPPADREARFTIRDDEPPFEKTLVTFHVIPRAEGGSLLRITQGVPAFASQTRQPANGDWPPLMRAA